MIDLFSSEQIRKMLEEREKKFLKLDDFYILTPEDFLFYSRSSKGSFIVFFDPVKFQPCRKQKAADFYGLSYSKSLYDLIIRNEEQQVTKLIKKCFLDPKFMFYRVVDLELVEELENRGLR